MFDNDEKWIEDMAALVFTTMLIIVIVGVVAFGFWLAGWL